MLKLNPSKTSYSCKKWLKISIATIFTILSIISILNYLSDPLWCFNHKIKLSKYKNKYNERMQKTNLLYFSRKNYNAILLGSSRSTYIDVTMSKKYKIFNYSASSLNINEYKGYINNANKIKPMMIKNIFLGLDFFSFLHKGVVKKEPSQYYNETSKKFYRFKTLLSYDALRKSKKNLLIKICPKERVYTSDTYIAYTCKRPYSEAKIYVPKKVKQFSQAFYTTNTYYKKYDKIIKDIKNAYPKSNFIVFTTPITKELFEELKKHNLYDKYEQWLKTLVSTFGQVYHFMYINNITKNSYENFYDGHHAYPSIATKIIQNIENNQYEDFGILLNKKNLNQTLIKLRKLNNAI